MPKGRIQLRLSEDVQAILDKHGRSVDALPDDKRPTRTEIIEQSVLIWDELERAGLFKAKEDIISLIRLTTQTKRCPKHDWQLAGTCDVCSTALPNAMTGEISTKSADTSGAIRTGALPLDVVREDARTAIDLAKSRRVRERTTLDAVGPTIESGRGKASVETIKLPLRRERVVSIPKPGAKK